jgi:hypothetical protein
MPQNKALILNNKKDIKKNLNTLKTNKDSLQKYLLYSIKKEHDKWIHACIDFLFDKQKDDILSRKDNISDFFFYIKKKYKAKIDLKSADKILLRDIVISLLKRNEYFFRLTNENILKFINGELKAKIKKLEKKLAEKKEQEYPESPMETEKQHLGKEEETSLGIRDQLDAALEKIETLEDKIEILKHEKDSEREVVEWLKEEAEKKLNKKKRDIDFLRLQKEIESLKKEIEALEKENIVLKHEKGIFKKEQTKPVKDKKEYEKELLAEMETLKIKKWKDRNASAPQDSYEFYIEFYPEYIRKRMFQFVLRQYDSVLLNLVRKHKDGKNKIPTQYAYITEQKKEELSKRKNEKNVAPKKYIYITE